MFTSIDRFQPRAMASGIPGIMERWRKLQLIEGQRQIAQAALNKAQKQGKALLGKTWYQEFTAFLENTNHVKN